MIPIPLGGLIIFFMAVGVTAVCALWFYSFWQERKREVYRRRIAIQCRICGTAYACEPKRKIAVTVCPVCRTPNERNKLQQI
jgi:hypothetical protein